jgi:signal transduction histidine kinase
VFKSLTREVIHQRAQAFTVIADQISQSSKPRHLIRELEDKWDVRIRLVAPKNHLNKKKIRIIEHRGYEIMMRSNPETPFKTTITVNGKPMDLIVRFTVDIERIEKQRIRDLWIICVILLVISIVIGRWAFNPLEKASEAMTRIAEGHIDHRVQEDIGSVREAFNQMADTVEGMILGQRSLLAGISHELRTPLTRLQLQTSLLEDRVDVQPLIHEIKEMDALIEMLLISSQLESGSFHLNKTRIELFEVVLDVLAEMDLGERYCSLKIPQTLIIKADNLLLRRVIWNLFSNVVKYTPNNCTVSVQAQHLNEGVEFICADSGEGVSQELLEQLSKPFWRLEHSRSKKTVGWGLGLSFVQSVVDAHSGRLDLENSHPQGLLVRVWIPN